MRPKVLVLTQVYEPEPNFITADVAEALSSGADVTVVTGHPNYPLGRFYHGTRYWKFERTVERGVTVWRLPFYPSHSLSPVLRGISYLSFVLVASLFAPLIAGRPDVVWVYHGPFATGISSIFFKAFHKSKVIFTCADLWPESFAAAGVVRSSRIMSLLALYRRGLNKIADVTICATRGTYQRMRLDGIPEAGLAIIPVWTSIPRTPNLESGSKQRSNSIVYTGNLGPAQNLETAIRAAAILKDEGVDVSFDFYGTGSARQELEELARAAGATNVHFHGRVSSGEAFGHSANALGQIVSLRRSELFKMTVPSKLYTAFAAGAPLLYGLEGEAADLAAASGGALSFDIDSPSSLVSAVKSLLDLSKEERDNISVRLRDYFDKNFNPHILLQKYRNVIFSTLAQEGQ